MKKLIYHSLVIFGIILIASCKKETPVVPDHRSTDTTTPSATIPATTGPQKTMKFGLTNYAGVVYEVVFSGSGNYTFDLLPNGKQNVDIQEGLYDITVYPVGNYTNHAIALTGLPPVFAPRAQFDDVHINSSSFELAIY